MKKFLILNSSALGDFVTLIPFIRLLKYNFQDSEITVATRGYYAPLFNYINFAKFIDIASIKIHLLFSENFNSDDCADLRIYDEIISFIGADAAIFKKNLKDINPNSFFIFPYSRNSIQHQSLYLISSYPFRYKKFFYSDINFDIFSNKHFIIHPGSGSKYKNIDIYFLIELKDKLEKSLKIEGVWVGGETESYLKYDKIIPDINIFDNLNPLFELFKECFFYIGNDSGVSHLANFCNIHSFTFFGPTSPNQWAPLGRKSYIFSNFLKCSPCNKDCKTQECLNFDLNKVVNRIEQEFYSCS